MNVQHNGAPTSPPGMTSSRSTKSSSFHSSDEDGTLADISHFEEIGLHDERTPSKSPRPSLTPVANGLPRHSPVTSPRPQGRTLASKHAKPRRSYPNLKSFDSNPRSTSLAVLTDPRPITLQRQRNHSTTSLHSVRSPSPNTKRRGSWQSERRTVQELEDECDDEDEDIPDGFVLDNVPLSPRPAQERPPSRAQSPGRSRERSKDRIRSVGNGTPAVAQAQGSLRSPTWKTDARPNPLKQRARSWNLAHAELNAEARALTEKLEEHADEVVEVRARRPNTWNPSRRASTDHIYEKRERIKSTPELPPLRKTNIMIDPLPVSKEKEAVLSRTRPSWLPPKDPAEERRHLKQYQKMVAASQKADERREAARRVKVESKDHAVDNSMHIWEHDILARWDEALRERRTREMWWKGIAPRSRGPVWMRAIGNDLGLSEASYQAALNRAQEAEARVKAGRGDAEDARRAQWFKHIRNDASDTWKDLRIFEVGGPLHSSLVDVLSAYAVYRNDIGYVSGSNTIAALLLLNLPTPESAFISLANLLNRPLPLSFYTSDLGAQASAYNITMQTLRSKSKALHDHLTTVDPRETLQRAFTSLFTGFLAVDEAARLWDIYVFEGDECLVWAAVALLLRKEMSLLGTKTVDELAAILADVGGRQEDRFIGLVREAR